MNTRQYPVFQPVSERAVLIEFGDAISPHIHAKVLQLDQALSLEAAPWFTEATPAYASILVCFDPRLCDHRAVQRHVKRLLNRHDPTPAQSTTHKVAICYDADLAPDLPELAQRLGCTTEQAIATHLSGTYTVFMYGFAPGYAYMAGVPAALRLPRKPAAVRDIPAGSVIVAGAQCLITTLTMPTGWWIIGQSPARILPQAEGESFLFNVGDQVRFHRVDRHAFNALANA